MNSTKIYNTYQKQQEKQGLSRTTTNQSFQHSLASNGESVILESSDEEEEDGDGQGLGQRRVPSHTDSLIFERTVEDPFGSLNLHSALSRTNSIVSLGNGRTSSIVSLNMLGSGNVPANAMSYNNNNNTSGNTNNTNSNSVYNNNGGLSRTNSWVDGRVGSSPGTRVSVSHHRTLENYISPSLDASAHLVGDKSTNLEHIHIETSQYAQGVFGSGDDNNNNNNSTTPGGSRDSNGSVENDVFGSSFGLSHAHRRPSTIGLYTTSGAVPSYGSGNNGSQGQVGVQEDNVSGTSPLSPLSPNLKIVNPSFTSAGSPGFVTSAPSTPVSATSRKASCSARPKVLRFGSYADILSDENNLRRPSMSHSPSSSILFSTNSFQANSSGNGTGTAHTPLAGFSIGSPLSATSSNKQGSIARRDSTNATHPLASNVVSSGTTTREEDLGPQDTAEGSDAVFAKLKPEEYKRLQYGLEQGGRSPFHSIKN